MMRRLWYLAKAQGNWAWLALAALLGFFLFLLLEEAFRQPYPAKRALRDVSTVSEFYLSLAAALLVTGAPSLERESGTAELTLTYRQPAWLRLLELLALPALLWFTALVVTGAVADRWYAVLDWAELFRTALPPAAALAGAALAGTALTRHQVGGVIAAGIWWAVDLTVPTRLNTWAYLFNSFQPRPDLVVSEMHQNLYLVGAGGLLLALWLAERRERWVAP